MISYNKELEIETKESAFITKKNIKYRFKTHVMQRRINTDVRIL